MKKLITIIILITFSTLTAFTYELPKPPKSQPGDENKTEVTVGEMRRAVFYFNLAVDQSSYINTLEDTNSGLVKEAKSINLDLEKETKRVEMWRTIGSLALLIGIIGGIAGGILIEKNLK